LAQIPCARRVLEGVMTANGKRVFIVYFSAAGSTRHVAQVMEKRIGERAAFFKEKPQTQIFV
jgi:hypothetical protein